MPYTPPARRSPVASQPNTPPRSLSISSQPRIETQVQDGPSNGSRQSLPQSAKSQSYIHKHRRSPSISEPTAAFAKPSPSESDPLEIGSPDAAEAKHEPSSGIRSRNFAAAKVNGTLFDNASPSSSPESSSDDESNARRGRDREVGGSLAELQAAIRTIEQHREGSPIPPEEKDKDGISRDVPDTCSAPSANTDGVDPESSPTLPLSESARKISHSRSSTNVCAFLDLPQNKFDSPARSSSDNETDEIEDLGVKPSLIRKKSGELVRPALRASSTGRRPSSMPGTPTYSKAVHFHDNSLEHVRHFLQVDRPIAVSAGSSPVEIFDDEMEFPLGNHDIRATSPTYDWEIRLPNFPRDTPYRSPWPVRTEKVYLSPDTRVLMGNVAVRNLAFHKLVVARFTLDYWKTTSEVVAEYNNDVRKKETNDGYDRFTFNIKLDDQANLENKTLFFCVRYNVRGQEHWDNNNATNYQVDFSKKFNPQDGKQSIQPNSTRPLNVGSRSKSPQQRPRSMPCFDDFSSQQAPYDFSSFPQPNAVVGDSRIRLRNQPSREILPDAPAKPKPAFNQQAFGNRYDFGASLSAAIQAANGCVPKASNATTEPAPVHKAQGAADAGKSFNGGHQGGMSQTNAPKPVALTTEKPALQSPSYHELLDKYCFVRSRPTMENQERTEVAR